MANSKLLLIQDVEDLGRSGDIVSVRPGYARNYLVPNKFGVVASASAIKMQARLQEERQKKAIIDKQEAEATANALTGLTVITTVKVDHDGHMYGSVSAGDVVQLIQDQHGIGLEKRSLQMKAAIKEVGVFEIGVKLKEGVTSLVTVKIVPEETQHHG